MALPAERRAEHAPLLEFRLHTLMLPFGIAISKEDVGRAIVCNHRVLLGLVLGLGEAHLAHSRRLLAERNANDCRFLSWRVVVGCDPVARVVAVQDARLDVRVRDQVVHLLRKLHGNAAPNLLDGAAAYLFEDGRKLVIAFRASKGGTRLLLLDKPGFRARAVPLEGIGVDVLERFFGKGRRNCVGKV